MWRMKDELDMQVYIYTLYNLLNESDEGWTRYGSIYIYYIHYITCWMGRMEDELDMEVYIYTI